MKKIVSILLGLFYLLLSVGINVNYHYCLGKLDTIEIFITDIHRCCEYESSARTCCDDEHYFFQLDEDHNLTQAGPIVFEVKAIVSADFVENMVIKVPLSAGHAAFPPENPPPPSPENAWLRFCAPIIYG